MAMLNEIVWRPQSTDSRANSNVVGILGLRMIFSLAQMALLNRHRIPD